MSWVGIQLLSIIVMLNAGFCPLWGVFRIQLQLCLQFLCRERFSILDPSVYVKSASEVCRIIGSDHTGKGLAACLSRGGFRECHIEDRFSEEAFRKLHPFFIDVVGQHVDFIDVKCQKSHLSYSIASTSRLQVPVRESDSELVEKKR